MESTVHAANFKRNFRPLAGFCQHSGGIQNVAENVGYKAGKTAFLESEVWWQGRRKREKNRVSGIAFFLHFQVIGTKFGTLLRRLPLKAGAKLQPDQPSFGRTVTVSVGVILET